MNFLYSTSWRISSQRGSSPSSSSRIGHLLVGGQQHAALDVHQRRRHHEELAGDFEVEHLHDRQILHVLVRDPLDRDVVNVHLLLLDEVEQQIERPLEDLQLDFVIGFHSLSPALLQKRRYNYRGVAAALLSRRYKYHRNPTASLTLRIVSSATALARSAPLRKTSWT